MLAIFVKLLSHIHHYHLTQQALRFLVIGFASTTISYISFIICLKFFDLHYLLSNMTGSILSIRFSYHFNKKWTFDSKESKQGLNYVLFCLGSILLSSIILKIIVEYIGVIPEIAFIMTAAITACINFLGIKFLIFKK